MSERDEDQIEVQWWIRRSDGEVMGGDYSFMTCDGPGHWQPALDDAEPWIADAMRFGDEPGDVQYELLRVEVRVHERRTITAADFPPERAS